MKHVPPTTIASWVPLVREPVLRNVPASQSQKPTQLKINAVSVLICCACVCVCVCVRACVRACVRSCVFVCVIGGGGGDDGGGGVSGDDAGAKCSAAIKCVDSSGRSCSECVCV